MGPQSFYLVLASMRRTKHALLIPRVWISLQLSIEREDTRASALWTRRNLDDSILYQSLLLAPT